ncbi:MAG: hypothetical protein EZS28_002709 [Streblomastix strix]|uniref:Tyr recombinase domain-containing protein n=1 Tax=Streblomastix strix TaxID=222440 RepID=A0A5J4X383_9EUKA|nr:MAG: hypothetical protein EZS28_002709 [Streblomastix strix]
MDVGCSDSIRCGSQWLGSDASNQQYEFNQDIWKMIQQETLIQSKGNFSNLSGTETIRSYSPSNEYQMSKDIERQQHRMFLSDEEKSSIFNSQTNRQDISNDRTKWMVNQSRTHQGSGQQGTRCIIQTCESGRLPDQIRCLNGNMTPSTRGTTQFRTITGLQDEFASSIVGRENFHYSTSNTFNFTSLLKRGESDSGTENEEDVVETSTWEDNNFTDQRGELGEALFKHCLQKSGLASGCINNIIRSLRGSWRRYACSLSSFFEYGQQKWKTIELLAETEERFLIIVNYISMKLDSKHTDASIIQERTSLFVLFELMGKNKDKIRNKTIEQIMKDPVTRRKKTQKEEQIQELNTLLDYIQSQAERIDEGNLDQKTLLKYVLTLFMIYSQEGIIIIKTYLGKRKSGDLEVTLSQVNNVKVRPVKWWRSWRNKRKPTNEWSQMQIWINCKEEQNWTCDQCSKGIREIMRVAGIEEKYTVTSIRKASISAIINLRKSKQEIDQWSRHGDASTAVRMFYDANNNTEISYAISKCTSEPSSIRRNCIPAGIEINASINKRKMKNN